MTSNTDTLSESSKPGMPTAIWVQLGSLRVAAVLSTSSWLSIMTRDIYRKVKEVSDRNVILRECGSSESSKIIDGCGGVKEVFKSVQLNVSIEDQIIPANLSVVRSLTVDLVLGGEFISRINGTFHFGLGAFQWQYENKVKITNFITDLDKLNVRIIESDKVSSPSTNKRQLKSANENESTYCGCDLENALLTMALHGKLAQKVDKKKKSTRASKTQSTGRVSSKVAKNVRKPEDEFLGFLKNCFVSDKKPIKTKKNASCAKSPKSNETVATPEKSEFEKLDEKLKNISTCVLPLPKDVEKWKTVYVLTKEMYDIFGGSSMVYNGIFWSKGNKFNLVFSEELDNKTTEGFHLIAIAKVIQLAEDNKWSRLRIVSSDKMVIHLLNSYLLTESLGSRAEMPFFTKLDYKAYEFICTHLGVVSPVKFEHADPLETSGLRKAERIIDYYVLDNSD